MAGERRKSKAGDLGDAIDRLAGLYEWGALQVATDPVAFLDRVAAEIRAARASPPPPPAKGEARSAADLSCPECGGASCHSPLPAVDTVCPECGGGRNWHRQHACAGRAGRGA